MTLGLLLDCDGVLADSEPLNHWCWSEVFRVHLGAPLPADPSLIIGLDLSQICELGARTAGRPVGSMDEALRLSLLKHKSELFLEHAPSRLRAVRGARRLVESAQGRSMPLAIVSSALRARLLRTLEILELADRWDAVLAGEDVLPGERLSKDWARAAALVGLPAAACVAVDDSPEGVASARKQGIGCVVGVATGLPEPRLRDAGAHWVVPGPWSIDLDLLAEIVSCASR